MSKLHKLQRSLRDALLRNGPPPAEILGGRVAAAARLAVYRNNVLGNLTGALALAYPAVRRLAGENFFAVAAELFISNHPPNSPDLYEYGAYFVDFLAQLPQAVEFAYLVDVARIEWAVCRAIHADTVPPLAYQPLIGRADAAFVAHPTLTLLEASTPAHAIWAAVLQDDPDVRAGALAAIDPAGEGERIAVWAPNGEICVRSLSAAEFALARELASGTALSQALPATGEDTATLFCGLLAEGFFSSLQPEFAS